MMDSRGPFPDVVIRASAGTGKTFQLSNRFVGLAAADEPFDTILAATFTRKGAGEILDRVLFRLAEAALEKEKLAELASYLEQGDLDRPACLALLRQMVRQLHRLRVGTLDSFFIQVARIFSLELGLPPGWQIVDEFYDERLRSEAIGMVLEEESTSDTVRLMHLLTKGEATRGIRQQIASLVGGLYDIYLEAPAEAWESLPRYKPLEPAALAAALDGLAQVDLPEGKQYPTAREQDLKNAQTGNWSGFLSKGIAAKVLGGDEQFHRKPIPAEVVAAYEPLVQHARAVVVGEIASQTVATRRLLERFDAAYRRLKLSRHAMRFGDITGLLSRTDLAEQMEELAYRLDARVSHLLLDEFQDTNPLQWRVLRPFARRVVGSDRHRSFFCVGDVKQAIFGWRGGVAEIFDALDDELDPLETRPLDTSYRSSPPVIDTVNRVFESLATNRALSRHPRPAARWAARFNEHTTVHANMPGYCRLMVAPQAEAQGDQNAATLQFAAAEVARLHGRLPGKTIGVLVRKNAAVARLIYELRLQEIEASEEGGNPLTDSPAVELVLSLLTLADHPGDTAARFHVANSPMAEKVGLDRYDDDPAATRLALGIRRHLMEEGYGPTLYDWARSLQTTCDRRDLSRLVQLVELGYGYETTATTRPGDFVRLVRGRKVEDPTSAEVRVMTLHQAKGLQFDMVVLPELDGKLTGQPPQMVLARPSPAEPIEKVCRYVAKPVQTLLPKPFAAMFEAHDSRVVEESLCLLYVALTRAIHALSMIIAPSRKNERTLPSTPAGLLRAALSDASPAAAESILYEHGDAAWSESTGKPKGPAPRLAKPRPLTVKLARASKRPARGLERRSPSQLEGGSRVDLADRLRLDTTAALDRGTLIHAWFETIEWLDDGPPSDDLLSTTAARHAGMALDVSALLGQFRAMLDRPAVSALLSKATYQSRSSEELLGDRPAASANVNRACLQPGLKSPRWVVERECPFAVREGDTLLNGMIDRLVLLYDGPDPVGAEVIDFKTDRLPAGNTEAIADRTEHYRPQLEGYCRAVAMLFGLPLSQVSARLAYVELGLSVTLP